LVAVPLSVEDTGGGLHADSGTRSDGGQRRPFVLLRHDHTFEPEDRFLLLRCPAQTTSGMILTADRRNRSPRWGSVTEPHLGDEGGRRGQRATGLGMVPA